MERPEGLIRLMTLLSVRPVAWHAPRSGIKVLAVLLLVSIFWSSPTRAGEEPQPYPPDALLHGVLDFREPTGIRGRLLFVDHGKQTVWLEWAQVAVAGTSSRKRWKRVPNEWNLAIQPLNQSQFYDLQQLPDGTLLEVVIQLDREGSRRILSFEKLVRLPKVDSRFLLPE